jgi:hypothetical protein
MVFISAADLIICSETLSKDFGDRRKNTPVFAFKKEVIVDGTIMLVKKS